MAAAQVREWEVLRDTHRLHGASFFYLNTAKGGGTNFPNVQNLTVQPVQGRGVLWPSVFDEKPGEVDDRTVHQALRAETPKYAMNVWLRERDYRTPYAKACD